MGHFVTQDVRVDGYGLAHGKKKAALAELLFFAVWFIPA